MFNIRMIVIPPVAPPADADGIDIDEECYRFLCRNHPNVITVIRQGLTAGYTPLDLATIAYEGIVDGTADYDMISVTIFYAAARAIAAQEAAP